jgi:hypothetical protein
MNRQDDVSRSEKVEIGIMGRIFLSKNRNHELKLITTAFTLRLRLHR